MKWFKKLFGVLDDILVNIEGQNLCGNDVKYANASVVEPEPEPFRCIVTQWTIRLIDGRNIPVIVLGSKEETGSMKGWDLLDKTMNLREEDNGVRYFYKHVVSLDFVREIAVECTINTTNGEIRDAINHHFANGGHELATVNKSK